MPYLLLGIGGAVLLCGGLGVLAWPLIDAWLIGPWTTTYGPVRCTQCGSRQRPIVTCADGEWRCARCCAAEGWDAATGQETEGETDVWAGAVD